MPDIPIVLLDQGLVSIPTYAKPGDAAVDLLSTVDVSVAPAGGRVQIPTGIAIALPEGYAALVLSRSGLATRHGICCLNAPGLIDSGYRGEIQVILLNTDPSKAYEIRRGDRVAQLMVIQSEAVHFRIVTELEDTERGDRGIGHTGR